MVMHGTHRARPLPDRGGHPLQRAAPDVTDREDAWYRSLERQWGARDEERTVRDCCGQRSVRQDEALRVELQRTSQPRGRGVCADEAEQPGAVDRPTFPGHRLLEGDALEVVAARERTHLGGGEELDARIGLDPFHE